MTNASSFQLSLEFFPPKTPEGVTKLAQHRQALYALQPAFCSVTYGAGGSTQQGTLSTVQAILDEGHEGAPHFSCVGATEDNVREQLQRFIQMGVKRIVALRGDLPSGYGAGEQAVGSFRYASDLVAFIRKETGSRFQLEVAAYPETHPQARHPQADLQAFATKMHAGADSAITQFFFNADAYFRFVEDARALGVTAPIVPGVMPIANGAGILRFADSTGADIPRWIRLRLQQFADDAESIRAFGLDVVSALCERLRDGGAPGLHFYTMNQSGLTLDICGRLGLRT